jgi:hypothetical protein
LNTFMYASSQEAAIRIRSDAHSRVSSHGTWLAPNPLRQQLWIVDTPRFVPDMLAGAASLDCEAEPRILPRGEMAERMPEPDSGAPCGWLCAGEPAAGNGLAANRGGAVGALCWRCAGEAAGCRPPAARCRPADVGVAPWGVGEGVWRCAEEAAGCRPPAARAGGRQRLADCAGTRRAGCTGSRHMVRSVQATAGQWHTCQVGSPGLLLLSPLAPSGSMCDAGPGKPICPMADTARQSGSRAHLVTLLEHTVHTVSKCAKLPSTFTDRAWGRIL